MKKAIVVFILTAALVACGKTTGDENSLDAKSDLITVNGLSGPEAARYDPELELFVVSNFNGEPAGNGYRNSETLSSR